MTKKKTTKRKKKIAKASKSYSKAYVTKKGS